MGKFGEIRDANTGETLVKLIGPDCENDALSISLRILTHQLQLRNGAERGGGLFGGPFGYGVEFENDVFLMHPYCWCEQDECLWCGGSGCQAIPSREPHKDGCYQQHLQAFAREHGEILGTYDGVDHYHIPYGSPKQKAYDAFKRGLCRRMRVSFKRGNETHCTCGVDAEWKSRYNSCECDWHVGRGRFRFGAAADAPNFWHKPSGLRVRWYKYIGRDNEVEIGSAVNLRDVIEGCLNSIGCPSLEAAASAYCEAEEEAAMEAKRAMEFWNSDEGQAAMQALIDDGLVRTYTFGVAQDDDDSES